MEKVRGEKPTIFSYLIIKAKSPPQAGAYHEKLSLLGKNRISLVVKKDRIKKEKKRKRTKNRNKKDNIK